MSDEVNPTLTDDNDNDDQVGTLQEEVDTLASEGRILSALDAQIKETRDPDEHTELEQQRNAAIDRYFSSAIHAAGRDGGTGRGDTDPHTAELQGEVTALTSEEAAIEALDSQIKASHKRPERDQLEFKRRDLTDQYFTDALHADGVDQQVTPLNTLVPPETIRKGLPAPQPEEAAVAVFNPMESTLASNGYDNSAWLEHSEFRTDHRPPVETLTPDRMAHLADTLHAFLYTGEKPVVQDITAENGTKIHWYRTALSPSSAAPGEKGRGLNIELADEAYTLHYLDQPIDGSEAKVGLWATDKTTDKTVWIVGKKLNGTWEYEGADIHTSLKDERNGGEPTWNTVEPTPDDVESVVAKIEHAVGCITAGYPTSTEA